jgi:hypothetical protein
MEEETDVHLKKRNSLLLLLPQGKLFSDKEPSP